MNINKKTNNFDFLRLLFSVIVAIVHCAELSNVTILFNVSQFISSKVAVDSFFIISGFLIFMSYDSSTSLKKYINKRVRRILPGYTFVIIICAFFMFFISTKSFFEYFNIEFIKYVIFNLLALNFIHPNLPGVFESNSLQAVNGALWTIKIEIMFYFIVPCIAFILSKINNKGLVLLLIYIFSVLYSIVMLWLYSYYNIELFIKLERQLPGQLVFFISGAIIYYFYEYFSKHALFILILACFSLGVHKFIINIYLLYPISLSIVVLYFAMFFKYLGNIGKYGDLSFGIYIWHFPIIQLFVFYNLFFNSIVGIVLWVFCLVFAAYLSWHLVEKRFLFKSSHYIVSETR